MTSHPAFFGHSAVPINPELFDFDTFDHLTMGDLPLQQEVLVLFRQQVSATCAELRQELTAEKVRSLMHTLRGSAASVGATSIVDLAKQWESEADVDANLNSQACLRIQTELIREAGLYFAETERILAPKFLILERQRQMAS